MAGSDGLFDNVNDARILELLGPGPEAASGGGGGGSSSSSTRLSNDHGGTVVLVSLSAAEGAPGEDGTSPDHPRFGDLSLENAQLGQASAHMSERGRL